MSELSAEQTRLAQLWEEHMRHEFQTCSTEDTLATMVEDSFFANMKGSPYEAVIPPVSPHADGAVVDRASGARNAA
jgi:hypothetical protein